MDQQLPETTIISSASNQPAAPTETGSRKRLFIIAFSVLIVLILLGVGGYLYMRGRSQAQKPAAAPTPTPIPITGAKFFLTAEPMEATTGPDSIGAGAQVKVSVFVKTDKDAANLFIAKLKFPNDLLEAKSINLRESTSSGFIKDWFISNWVENTIDNKTGSASLVGGVPNPGFQTSPESSGSAMADVIFTTKSAGNAIVSFDDTSAIYRNSDNSNILVMKEPVTIKISGKEGLAAPIEATPSPTLTPALSPTPLVSPSATPSGPPEGDVNGDGVVNLQDLSALLSAWGKVAAGAKTDLNKDGLVNAFDYSKLTTILKNANTIQ